ncbi:hypothetical protein [Rugosimonospora africana]|uniref:Uncharacterized protein n=1 Tax=Rugosimonospora africana TaxID=556532 RepID=A0A8J3VX49_9ACTN|nr:hypothetical protein [Rugosimonospora africana]GIH21506.1 hypothetical protein Raf01_96780 [Rugosimonospora africana]
MRPTRVGRLRGVAARALTDLAQLVDSPAPRRRGLPHRSRRRRPDPRWQVVVRRARRASTRRTRRPGRATTVVGVVILVLSAALSGGAYLLYQHGLPTAYEHPHDWGRVHFLVPAQASACQGELNIDQTPDAATGWPRLTMTMSFTLATNPKSPPAVGIVMDIDAQPPDYFWPLPADSVTTTGDLPSADWHVIAGGYGIAGGHLWLLRVPYPGKSYTFSVKQAGSEVADHHALSITGAARNRDGRIALTLTVRPRGAFAVVRGSRATYTSPLLLGFEAIPTFHIPGFQDSIGIDRTGVGACGNDSSRQVTFTTPEALDDNRVDPLYRIDSVSPALTGDALRWSTTDATDPLSPTVSLVNRVSEAGEQRALFLSGVVAGVAAALAPVGLPLLPWRSALDSAVGWRARRRRNRRRRRATRARQH